MISNHQLYLNIPSTLFQRVWVASNGPPHYCVLHSPQSPSHRQSQRKRKPRGQKTYSTCTVRVPPRLLDYLAVALRRKLAPGSRYCRLDWSYWKQDHRHRQKTAGTWTRRSRGTAWSCRESRRTRSSPSSWSCATCRGRPGQSWTCRSGIRFSVCGAKGAGAGLSQSRCRWRRGGFSLRWRSCLVVCPHLCTILVLSPCSLSRGLPALVCVTSSPNLLPKTIYNLAFLQNLRSHWKQTENFY